ncbi:MAG: hypothetical protein CVU46_07620 [Chloroflexi bacterium HGW-Chloroflexi-8]|nr:MAG: hypothetical protein CVU46_07620 [Chloroflexi bacterium HGW-Chloroflexi-8]
MNFQVRPIEARSLKEVVIQTLEGWILSGDLKIGEKLPSERDLAQKMKISRPVLHEALVDLASKGLVKIEARRGIFINDYRINGSCALLSSMLNFHQDQLDPVFGKSLIDMRMLIEVETAKLAAIHADEADIRDLQGILEAEKGFSTASVEDLVELDFNFHLQIALASCNRAYPLILNSFKAIYTHLTENFFTKNIHTPILEEVFTFHHQLVNAIKDKDSIASQTVMVAMLKHGEKHLSGGSHDG